MPPRSTGVMETSLGCSTRPFTTYSRKACIKPNGGVLSRDGGCLGSSLDKAGHGLARLRAFAQPITRALQVERIIVAFFERMISAEFLDALAVAGTAAIGHHDAKNRLVLRANALHTNFNCHKSVSFVCGLGNCLFARAAAALFEKEGRA